MTDEPGEDHSYGLQSIFSLFCVGFFTADGAFKTASEVIHFERVLFEASLYQYETHLRFLHH